MNRPSLLRGVGNVVCQALFFFALTLTSHAQDWTTLSNSLEPRVEGHSAVIDGKMFVFGGFQVEPPITLFPIDGNEVYAPATNTWSTFAPLPVPITHVGSAIVDKTVWLAGGYALFDFQQIVNHVYIYDTETDSWTTGPPLPLARAGGALARNGRKLHYFSGLENRNDDVGDHWILDLDEEGGPQTWVPAAPLPTPRNHLSGVAVGGKIYAVGGQQNHDVNPQDTKLMHIYDPSTDTWTQGPDLPALRSHYEPGTFVVDGKIILVGGKSGTATCINNVTQFDTQTNTWQELFTMPNCLLAPASKVIGDELFVANGGETNVYSPQVITRKHPFTRTPSDVLDFWPKTVSSSLTPGETEKKESVLFTLTGEADYTIDTSSLPAWITSITGVTGTADIPGAEVDLILDATGLSTGVYTYIVTATAAGYQDAQFTVELTVSDAGNAVLEIEPAIVDLGALPVGYTVAQEYTITNTGDGSAILENPLDASVVSGLVDFRPDGGTENTVLTPGTSVTHTAYITPTGAGALEVSVQYEGAAFSATATATGTTIARINAGGTAIPEPSQPDWGADLYFEGGQSFTNQSVTTIAGTGTSSQAPYFSERSAGTNLGSFAYRIPTLIAGTYITRLHFAETYFGAPGGTDDFVGRRVFDVNIEGGPVELDDFDIAAEAGPLTAVVKTFMVDVVDGVLDIEFAASVDQPKVTGIEVFYVDPAAYQPVATGWNLIALPVSVDNNDYQSIFTNVTLALQPFAYVGQQYAETTSLFTGNGYWIKNGGMETFQAYNGSFISSVTLNLATGWQLVGGPSCLFPLDQATGDVNVIAGDIFNYVQGSGYQASTHLVPGKGYWIQATANGIVSMTCPSNLDKRAFEAPVASETPFTQLTLTDAQSHAKSLFLANDVDATYDMAAYALPPYPPAGEPDVRFNNGSSLLDSPEGILRIQSMQAPVTLALDGQGAFTIDWLLGQDWVEAGMIQAGRELVLDTPDIEYLRIRSLDASLPETPGDFALRGVYPNPFQSSGTLVFDTPEEARIRVEIFSMLGQRMGQYEVHVGAGAKQSIQLERDNLASGMYVYRITAETSRGDMHTEAGRFVIMK